MSADQAKANGAAEKAGDKVRLRSPNYPFLGLREAVKRAVTLYKVVSTAGAAPDPAARIIGYSKAHGTAKAALSALKKFGLIEEKNGRVVPTMLTATLANYGPDTEKYRTALLEAVLKPELYKEIHARYLPHGILPPSDTLKPDLVIERGFHPDKVDGFLSDFRDSLTMAGLLDGTSLKSGDGAGDETQGGGDAEKPQPGDRVQWTVNGADQFPAPRAVLGYADDDHLWVEGVNTGVPVSQAMVVEKAASAVVQQSPVAKPPVGNPFLNAGLPADGPAPAGRKREIYAMDDGDVILDRPARISPDEVEGLETWFQLLMAKIKKSPKPSE